MSNLKLPKRFKDKIELFFNNQTNEIISYFLAQK